MFSLCKFALMKNFLPLSFLAFLFFLSNKTSAQCAEPVVNFSDCNFMAIGHRAYSAVYPENTLISLEELLKLGVKYAEVDVTLTKDGHYILFHDEKSVYRTTNASGLIGDYNLSEIKQWDVGSWRGYHFSGMRMATLEEALLIAEKYNAHLYLDCKNYNVPAMKTALQNTGVALNRLMPSIATIDDAVLFRQLLPNTPWIWYSAGNLPTQIDADTFYQRCISLGCVAFEVSSGKVNDSLWDTFKTKVHANGGKVVVFTANFDDHILALKAKGIDGLESDRAWEASKLFCNGTPGHVFDSATTGNWLFEGDLRATGVGSQMRNINLTNPQPNQNPLFASCSVFGIAPINNNKVVMKVPALTPENGLLVYNNFRVEDYGILDQSFTVIMDFLMPTESANKWISLFQTSVTNGNDADLFINPAGKIGISSEYHGNVLPNTWHRLAFTVDGNKGFLSKYLDGQFIGASAITGSRWAVWNSSRSGDDQGFLIFGDDDNETADMYLAAMQIRDYVMDSISIRKLGSATGNIKLGNADSWFATLSGAYADSTLLDFENRTYYFVIPANSTTDSATISYTLTTGAQSNKPLSYKIALNTPTHSWQVTSQDSLTQATWTACIRKAKNTNNFTNKYEQQNLQVNIYPNPANKQITIAIPMTNSTNEVTKFELFDVLGKKVKQGVFTQEYILNVSDLNSGIFWLTTSQNGAHATQKLVINK